jgi:hypothetical protein
MAKIGIESGQGRTTLHVPVSVGAGTTELVAAQGAGQRVRVYNYAVVATVAGTVKFTDGTDDLTGAMSFAANGGIAAGGAPSEVWFESGLNRPLNIVASGATEGHLSYVVEP